MVNENIKEIVFKDRETRLNISRVPKKTREEFTKFAEEEFEGDYGMLLKELWEKYKDYSMIQQTFDVKLNYIIQLLENEKGTASQERKPEKNIIKFLDGRKVEKGVKK
ncbi:hypothetical protein LCGC14_1336020 [marine sediment metagenome]|uniref:Uncharacterized protein n=1 Tax=marine sediment metagenome TaxID=412755 RepID=A0A0F9L193_9ZZZZ